VATCKRSECEQCMTALNELPSRIREDMVSSDSLHPTEHQNVVLIDPPTLRKAQQLIESREHCYPEGAEIPFDNILDRVTRSEPSVTDYILEAPAKCPNCRRNILEKTLVEPTE